MQIISRKIFLKKSMTAALLINPILKATSNAHHLKEIGLITNVLDDELKKDWKSTLETVAKIGYTYLEFNNFYGNSRDYFKQFLKEIKLKPLNGGSSLGQMKKDEVLKKMIEEALFFEKKYLTCYWPWMDSGDNKTLDDFKIAADELNDLGAKCKKEGIRLAFHNHDKEFVSVEGHKWGYEVLLEQTDPQNVAMLLDLYWITKGKGNPIELLKKYPDRFEMFHVKDMDKTPQQSFTCPGYGCIDFTKIFEQVKKRDLIYYTVEIDSNPQPIQCIRDSYSYLKNLRF
jgi:sugar phosphate isomerase/epimerase